MCGRYSLEAGWEEIVAHFSLARPRELGPTMPHRYNIAPTQPIMMIGNADDGIRQGMLARWGLIPSWVKDPKKFALLLNARAETAIEKPSFRVAMRHRRMLIPANGFYEWKRYGKGQKSQAYWVRPKHRSLFAFGALMETYADPNGSEIDTGCIITTDTNKSFSSIHHRLPLIIQPKDYGRWLDCKTQEPREVVDLMNPVDDDFFECITIGDAVNKVANSGKEIQQQVEPLTPNQKKQDNQISLFE